MKIKAIILFVSGLLLPVLGFAEVNRSWDALVADIETGRSVVVKRMNGSSVEGKLLEISAESIIVREGGQPLEIARDQVFRVRYANIRRKHTLIGMGVGAGIGFVIGAAQDTGISRATTGTFSALVGTGFGALGGGVLPIGNPLYEVEKPRTARKAGG